MFTFLESHKPALMHKYCQRFRRKYLWTPYRIQTPCVFFMLTWFLFFYYFSLFLKTLLFLNYLFFLKMLHIVKYTATYVEVTFFHLNLFYWISVTFYVNISKTFNPPCGLALYTLAGPACRELWEMSLYHRQHEWHDTRKLCLAPLFYVWKLF